MAACQLDKKKTSYDNIYIGAHINIIFSFSCLVCFQFLRNIKFVEWTIGTKQFSYRYIIYNIHNIYSSTLWINDIARCLIFEIIFYGSFLIITVTHHLFNIGKKILKEIIVISFCSYQSLSCQITFVFLPCLIHLYRRNPYDKHKRISDYKPHTNQLTLFLDF